MTKSNLSMQVHNCSKFKGSPGVTGKLAQSPNIWALAACRSQLYSLYRKKVAHKSPLKSFSDQKFYNAQLSPSPNSN